MNRPCAEMQEHIADYVLGALESEETGVLRAHLGGCANCRQYLQSLEAQGRALVSLGEQVGADMSARQDRAIQALEGVVPVGSRAGQAWPFLGGLIRTAVAAVLILAAGITIGRWTAPQPADVEQLRADLEASIAAALGPAVRESVLSEVNQHLQSAASTGDTQLKVEIAEQMHRDLQAFAAQFVSGAEALMDQRSAELVQLVEAARLKDRQRVERAFRQLELTRLRDKTEIGRGIWTLAAQTTEAPITTQN
jgi:anti-sigma factor RsiW